MNGLTKFPTVPMYYLARTQLGLPSGSVLSSIDAQHRASHWAGELRPSRGAGCRGVKDSAFARIEGLRQWSPVGISVAANPQLM
ncbi:hypothetical protein AVEN_84206-1 [Araneus ventricosus]|uniref:Uncharacterized protein n=1 Tax=Araneus ventricosus TaxID=182803 RepID=A0A4Y2L1A0_ARAVE|nr:hypothetical protein AVEN_84206-1 [Araneus ventricosus]